MATEVWTPAFIGLGSNLDDPPRQVARAAGALAGLPRTRVHRCSPAYRSPPLGPADQPDYVNAVVALLTRLAPQELLSGLQRLERDLGRIRPDQRWGPRNIDMDLLLYGDTVSDGGTLTLPHPGLVSRAFVLMPLADLAPLWRLPDGRRVCWHLRACDVSQLERLGELGET